jgi:integrase
LEICWKRGRWKEPRFQQEKNEMALKDIDCRNAKPQEKPYKLTDGSGLQLWVHTSGSRTWRMSYRLNGKQKTATFGQYPVVSLAEARIKRDEIRRQLWDGVEPTPPEPVDELEDRRFRTVAKLWFDNASPKWVPAHQDRVWARMVADVFPEIGDMNVADITAQDILKLVRKVEDRGALDISRRIRQSVGKVFKYAIVEGWAQFNPSSEDLNIALKPKPQVRHFAFIKESELPEFFGRLRAYEGDLSTRFAIMLTIQTMVRTTGTRGARWVEFEDLDGSNPIWRIPKERMKKPREHLTPLSTQTVALLREIRRYSGKYDQLFPAPTKDGMMSQNTMLFAMYRMGYHSRATIHGFRRTASTILNENQWNSDWIEKQLAHDEEDDVRAAYNAAEYLPHRREMVQWWCDRLDALAANGRSHVALG